MISKIRNLRISPKDITKLRNDYFDYHHHPITNLIVRVSFNYFLETQSHLSLGDMFTRLPHSYYLCQALIIQLQHVIEDNHSILTITNTISQLIRKHEYYYR